MKRILFILNVFIYFTGTVWGETIYTITDIHGCRYDGMNNIYNHDQYNVPKGMFIITNKGRRATIIFIEDGEVKEKTEAVSMPFRDGISFIEIYPAAIWMYTVFPQQKIAYLTSHRNIFGEATSLNLHGKLTYKP